MNARRDRDDIQVDPRLDHLLRQMLQSDRLSDAQHERIQRRIGFGPATVAPGAASSRPAPTLGNVAGNDWDRVPTIVNDDEQENVAMFPQTRRIRRTEWLELAAVLAAVLVAAVIVAVMRGEPEGAPQQGSSPDNPPVIVTTPTPTPVIVPTPDADGVYRGLTVEQARLVITYPLVFPTTIPSELEEPDISIEQFAPGDGGEAGFDVRGIYHLAGGTSPEQSIEYIQTTRAPQNPPGGDMSVVELGGKHVNKAFISGMGGPALAVYWWQSGDVYAQVIAQVEGELTVELVEEFVGEILRNDDRVVEAAAGNSDAPHSIGETVSANDLAVTISGVTRPDDPTVPTPQAGMTFILISGEIRNLRAEAVPVQSMLNFTIQDLDGQIYTSDVNWTRAVASDLPPGETVEFEVGFEILETTNSFLLTWDADPTGTGESVVFQLGTP